MLDYALGRNFFSVQTREEFERKQRKVLETKVNKCFAPEEGEKGYERLPTCRMQLSERIIMIAMCNSCMDTSPCLGGVLVEIQTPQTTTLRVWRPLNIVKLLKCPWWQFARLFVRLALIPCAQ